MVTKSSVLVGCDTRSVFIRSSYVKVKERSLPYYLPIPGGRIVGFIPLQVISVM